MRFLVVEVIDPDECYHGWLMVVMETTMIMQRSGGNESVMRRCWYVFFPDEDSASCDSRNTRRSGFSSLAWRTVQPAEDLSFSQWCCCTFSCLSMVQLLRRFSSQWCGCTFSRSKIVPVPLKTIFLMVQLHLFLPFNVRIIRKSFSQWCGYAFSRSRMVPVPLEILFLMTRLHLFLSFNGATSLDILLSMVWLHLFTL